MSKNLIHEKFVGAIREKIPHKATLTNTLVELLRLERGCLSSYEGRCGFLLRGDCGDLQ